MPIYEYRCSACGHEFERLLSMSADAPPCPACEKNEVKKLISASGFILKGSGWYSDHYGLKKGGKSGGEGGSSGSGGSSSSSSSSSSGSSGSSSDGGGSTGSSTAAS